MYLHSISAHVDDIVDRLDESSAHALRTTPLEKIGQFHHSWGRAIRNEYGFWKDDHPLTANWHKYPENRIMKDHSPNLVLDCSPDHPDSVSMEIMKGVWKKINA